MSILPKRGICFSCGHNHGDGFGSPDLLRVLKTRGDEVAAYQAEIADLRTALQAANQRIEDLTTAAQRADGGEAKPVASDQRLSYWLVESVHGAGWWDGRTLSRGIDPRYFTSDPNLAVRFARREDANRVIDGSSSLTATEHIWIDAAPPASVQPDSVRDAALTNIRGPLRDSDRQHCMSYAASLGIGRDSAEAIVSCVAPKAYVNGFKDAEPAPFEPTKEQFEEWCERHGIQPVYREAFYDAASLYLMAAQQGEKDGAR